MGKNELKFTLHDLKSFLLKKKECPYCGNKELIRHTEKMYKGRKRCTDNRMNLMFEDVYITTFVYECQICKRKYSLQGLRENIELNDSKNINNSRSIKTRKEDNESDKRKIWIFANLWCFISTLILLTTALQDKNFIIIFIFAPFILLMYFIFRLLIK